MLRRAEEAAMNEQMEWDNRTLTSAIERRAAN